MTESRKPLRGAKHCFWQTTSNESPYVCCLWSIRLMCCVFVWKRKLLPSMWSIVTDMDCCNRMPVTLLDVLDVADCAATCERADESQIGHHMIFHKDCYSEASINRRAISVWGFWGTDFTYSSRFACRFMCMFTAGEGKLWCMSQLLKLSDELLMVLQCANEYTTK